MMSSQIPCQTDRIGAIGTAMFKGMTTCLRLEIRFHAPFTTTVRSIAGEGTTMDNSVWATSAGERRHHNTLTSALGVPSPHWVSMIQELKDGHRIPMHALCLTTVIWCVGVPMETDNSYRKHINEWCLGTDGRQRRIRPRCHQCGHR